MPYKDKEKMLAYRRKYYREYYHKNKPENVKSSGIKNGTIIIQYYKIVKSKTDFVDWMIKINEVHDELVEKLKLYYKYLIDI